MHDYSSNESESPLAFMNRGISMMRRRELNPAPTVEEKNRAIGRTTRMFIDALKWLIENPENEAVHILLPYLSLSGIDIQDIIDRYNKQVKKDHHYIKTYTLNRYVSITIHLLNERNPKEIRLFFDPQVIWSEIDIDLMRFRGQPAGSLFIDHHVMYKKYSHIIELYHKYDK